MAEESSTQSGGKKAIASFWGREWVAAENPRITHDYFSNMKHLRPVFSSEEALQNASREQLPEALMGFMLSKSKFDSSKVAILPSSSSSGKKTMRTSNAC
jgi:RNase P/RNase MRP subunit POP5